MIWTKRSGDDDPDHAAGASASAPDIEFQTDDGCTHRLWIVSDASRSLALRASLQRASSILRTGITAKRAPTTAASACSSGTYTPEDSVNCTMMFLIDMDNDGLIVFRRTAWYAIWSSSANWMVERMNAEFNIKKREDLDCG